MRYLPLQAPPAQHALLIIIALGGLIRVVVLLTGFQMLVVIVLRIVGCHVIVGIITMELLARLVLVQ